jgi:hypothetical protein
MPFNTAAMIERSQFRKPVIEESLRSANFLYRDRALQDSADRLRKTCPLAKGLGFSRMLKN